MQLQSKDKWSNYSKIKVILKVSKPNTDKEVFHNKVTYYKKHTLIYIHRKEKKQSITWFLPIASKW